MDLDDLKNYANNPDFISGIHNYCDRWCERCYMSSYCSVFAFEFHSGLKNSNTDEKNREFWEAFKDQLEITLQMLDEMIQDIGDIDEATSDKDIDDTNGSWERKEVRQHPLVRNCYDYMKYTTRWIDTYRADLYSDMNNKLSLYHKEVPDIESDNISFRMNDFLDIISWYVSLIPVKAQRAIDGLFNPWENEDPIQNDKNGSAKVLLISVKRSMAAWNGLADQSKEHQDTALSLITLLDTIHKQIHYYFPEAEQFKRPGFDA